MRCACIDVGSNTTRLLVADSVAGGIKKVRNERVFTLIGRSLGDSRRIPPEKIDETVAAVADQVRLARELGTERIRAVATAAVRQAANADELVAAVERRTGIALDVLEGEEEARLAFRGAARAAKSKGKLAVIDVGGGSTEIAIGDATGRVAIAESVPVGSLVVTERYLPTDPPQPAELDEAREEIARTFAGFEPPAVDDVAAVGGSARSLLRVASRELRPADLDHALDALCAEPADALGPRVGLDPIRVRVLPAGALVLAELARRFDRPLRICKGGLREGVILDMTGNV